MRRTRYPRPGHRLAPTALQELLRSPVPSKYLEAAGQANLRLCDLDESAWERFGPEACGELAGEVVQAVGRAARTSLPIGDRLLPPIPPGLTLADLELEIRTLNCLIEAQLHLRPQDLKQLSIDAILRFRGFWVKCLVDLLTSIEYVIEHPEAVRAMKNRSLTRVVLRQASPYPRPGHRIAPALLADWLDVPAPESLVGGTAAEGLRLCELDQAVWQRIEPELIARLASAVVTRVGMAAAGHPFHDRRLPALPPRMRLEELPLENRTYNALCRARFDQRPESLGRQTLGHLLALPAFGAKCLVDLLTSIETLSARQGPLDEQLSAEARTLSTMAEADRIHFDDPRLGNLLREADSQANTVAELAQRILHRTSDPADPGRLAGRLAEVRRRIEQLRLLTLEEELVQVFLTDTDQRDRQIAAEYFGWDGLSGRTLEDVGREHGLSRERVRQVCGYAAKRNGGRNVFTPIIDRAIALVVQQLPSAVEPLDAVLAAAKLSASGLGLATVLQAVEFLGRRPPLALAPVGGRLLAVPADRAALPKLIVQVARHEVQNHGATTAAEIVAQLAAQGEPLADTRLVLETLQLLDDFQWLDRQRGWFQVASLPQYGLPSVLEKILAVVGRVEVGALRSAVARYRRSTQKLPPASVLLEACRRMQGVRIEESVVVAHPRRDWHEVLCGVEADLVGVLLEHGPILERGLLEEHCTAKGMNRFSFNAVLMCSPVIAQFERSVYGLLGARVDRRALRTLAARRTGAAPKKVLCSFGRMDDGRVYLRYRLSKAAIAGGVMTVPASMRDVVAGKYRLSTADGRIVGTLVAKNGCAWGLGPALRQQALKPGDLLVLLLATDTRQAVVLVGAELPGEVAMSR